MPNRLIHEKALRSHTLARLSAEAERLFWRLTAIADDQGRFDAYPSTVKADCFPTMVDSVKTKDVIAWLVELSQECCKFYTVDGRQYGYFVKWAEYQRIYGNKPKFPQPPADCGSSPQSPALILTPTPTPITTSTPISTTTCPSVMDDEFEQFWMAYPKRVGKKDALKAWKAAKDKPPLTDILLALKHAKEGEQWMRDGGQFIPHPSTWLNKGRWADDAQPVVSAFQRGMDDFLSRHGGDV